MLRNNALFLEKAKEEYNPGAQRHWGCNNKHRSLSKTPF